MNAGPNTAAAEAPALSASGANPWPGGAARGFEGDTGLPAAALVLPWVLAVAGFLVWRWLGRAARPPVEHRASWLAAWCRSWLDRPEAPHVQGVTALGAGHRLYVVTWRQRDYLIGIGPGAAPALIDHRSPDPSQSREA